MSALTIRRIGWAGYVVTTEEGTRLVIDPYLHGGEGPYSRLPDSPVTVDEVADADAAEQRSRSSHLVLKAAATRARTRSAAETLLSNAGTTAVHKYSSGWTAAC